MRKAVISSLKTRRPHHGDTLEIRGDRGDDLGRVISCECAISASSSLCLRSAPARCSISRPTTTLGHCHLQRGRLGCGLWPASLRLVLVRRTRRHLRGAGWRGPATLLRSAHSRSRLAGPRHSPALSRSRRPTSTGTRQATRRAGIRADYRAAAEKDPSRLALLTKAYSVMRGFESVDAMVRRGPAAL